MFELPRIRYHRIKDQPSSMSPLPEVGENEVLIKVIESINVTRHDMWRRFNNWKDSQSEDYNLRMQFSGLIVRVGSRVIDRDVGDQVCGLLKDRRCTELIAIPSWRVIRVPKGINVYDAAALPYAASVVFHSFIRVGKLMPTCSVMIYDGAGEFGALAIQLAKFHGCQVFTTGKNEREFQYCKELGADYCIKHNWDSVYYVMRQTNGTGVDFVFDPFGDRLIDNMEILGHGGTYVISESIDWNAGMHFDLIGKKQIKLIALSIWTLPPEEQRRICRELIDNLWPMFESGILSPRAYKRKPNRIFGLFDIGSIFLDEISSFVV